MTRTLQAKRRWGSLAKPAGSSSYWVASLIAAVERCAIRHRRAKRARRGCTAHIRSPGNWLACFTQATNCASSSWSSS